MVYRAKVSFCGLVTMRKGEEKEIKDKDIVKDLLKAGYIEEVKTEKTKTAKK